MALREFTDSAGARWKVWDVTPEALHPITRAEDYLQGYLEGWLVFESEDGDKRRLYPVPVTWLEIPEDELERLCQRAESVRSLDGEREVHRAPTADRARGDGPAGGMRSFVYPGGRVWSVAEMWVILPHAPGVDVKPRRILRFTSGRRSLDLLAYPPDWANYSDDDLGDLLFRAFPRDAARPLESDYRRRRGDATR